MTKDEVKTLCEDDDKLQWWAMVLFAEIMEVASVGASYENNEKAIARYVEKAIARYVRIKVEEFPRLVIQRQLEKVKEKLDSTETEDEK